VGAVLVARLDKLVETVSMLRGITAPCKDKKKKKVVALKR